MSENKYVDVIEEGRVVRVPEDYAIKEGLMIIRRPEMPIGQRESEAIKKMQAEKKEKDFFSLDKLRKPVKKNGVVDSLVDNFHWIVSQKRKERNMSRKQLAEALGVRENDVKMVENGILPSEDYILINKLQSYLGLNLRKDGQDFVNPISVNKIDGHKYSLFRKKEIKSEESKKDDKEELLGKDIEIEELD